MTTSGGGRIITFYSYKGGTGRTMALGNVAWILAAHGERVLAVDWDLEAPGLHRFFLPFMGDPDLRESDGLVDLVSEYVEALGKLSEAGQVTSDILRLADPRRHAIALEFDFEREGCLHLLAAGRQDEQYAERVRGLDWQRFYTSFGGEAFIEHFAATMRQQYDYVLIDSRTGVADSAGICTMQMPDQVVLCFTYNRQSVEGVAAAANSISAYAASKERPIKLLPLPTRIVPDIEGLEDARHFAQERLGQHLAHLKDREDLLAFWASAEVRHYPAYGFEETLATFREQAGGRNNLLADMEWLTGQISGARGTMALPRMKREVRERYLHRFRLRDPRRADLDEAMTAEPAIAFRRIRSMVAEAASYGEAEWRSTLANALERVAATLAESGARDDALAATEEAVAIRRELAAKAPDAYRPDLATALNNLANRLSEVGQRQEALAPAQEAADFYRALAAKAPDDYRPALAMALGNLASRLSGVGQREAALAPAQDAADLYRGLAAMAPDAYRPALAMALNNLAIRLSAVGQRQAALAPAKEAADLYRALAAKAPGAWRPDLAGALNTLANRLSEVGQREAALAPAKEAADLYRALAANAPDAYRPGLAVALNNMASHLSTVGQREAALAPAQEAVAIRRALAANAPDAYRPALALALNNMASHLSAVGQRQEALALAQEAVAIRRDLAAKAPDAYQPAFALALNNMASRLSEVGQRQEAHQAAEEAVRALAPRFLTLPAAFAPRMRAMVRNYKKRCEEIDSEPDAELLTPILQVLQLMQDRSGGEEAQDGEPSA